MGDESYSQEAYYLLQELTEARLVVIIEDGLRKVIQENAEWYREFCANHVSLRRRRLRTIIKRRDTCIALQRIINGEPINNTKYGYRLAPFLERMRDRLSY